MDETVQVNGQSASIGGVLSDASANWIRGFTMSFGMESMFKVETRAMLEGLKIAWDKGYRKVKVESTNVLLVELLLVGGKDNSTVAELWLLHHLLCRR